MLSVQEVFAISKMFLTNLPLNYYTMQFLIILDEYSWLHRDKSNPPAISLETITLVNLTSKLTR